MSDKPGRESGGNELPGCATEFIRQVVRKMRYGRKAAEDVRAELTAHFEDELHGCASDPEREQKAQRLIADFGDIKLLAVLCRRAKKRCRPWWATAMVRTVQGAGVLLVLFVVYTIWFVSGKPAPRVDYVAVLNRMSRPEIAEADNAWPHYEKAFAALVEPSDELKVLSDFPGSDRLGYRSFAGLPADTRTAILQWVQANERAFQEFATAAAMPYAQRVYVVGSNAREGWVMGVLLPDLPSLRNLARVAICRSRIEVERGDLRQAIDDCLTVAKAGRHQQPGEILVEQLVGMAMSQLTRLEILGILYTQDLPADELSRLQQELTRLYPGGFPLIDVEGERLGMLDTIQRVFTDGGPGGGHMTLWGATELFTNFGDLWAETEHDPGIVKVPVWTAMGMVHAGRDDTLAKANWLYDKQAESVKLSPCERRLAKTPGTDTLLKTLPKYRYSLIHILVPAIDRAADLAFRGRALHEGTIVVVALRRHRLEKGGYPASLEELKRAGYIDAVPADPYSDGPLVYRVTGDRFTLYSVGPDFDDDGGTPGKNRKGQPCLWNIDDGDSVFWPVTP